MGKSGSELLVYGLIIAGFLLFNFLAQKLAKKAREQQEAAERAAADALPEAPEEELDDPWGRRPVTAVQVPEQRPAPRPAPPPARPAETRRLFRNRQDLRHAIVLMTVLGPCRALEPPEQR